MRVIDFSFISADDPKDSQYENWSRCYEYPWALSRLRAAGARTVHNTGCGGGMVVHLKFIDALSKEFETIHSDIDIKLLLGVKTQFCNITHKLVLNKFDAVLSISTIEHIKDEDVSVIKIIENLVDHTKENGVALITFDYPIVNLEELEDYLKTSCVIPENILTDAMTVDGIWYEELQIVRLELAH